MSDFIAETVADLTENAADVGNKSAALKAQKVLQEQKDRIDGQLAAEIVAMKKREEASSETYRRLLGETTALSTAMNAAKADARVAAIKEERLDLAKLAPQGGEKLIAQADAKMYSQVRHGLTLAKQGYKTQLNLEVPMPVIKQDTVKGENKVFPVKAAAPEGDSETSIEASYLNYEAALRNEFAASGTGTTSGNFVIPTLVVDLIGYLVTYPRLFNKFRVYQTTGVETLLLNRITGVPKATTISTSGVPTGEKQNITNRTVSTSNVELRALKVAGLTRITPELVNTLPADMLQSRISSYLAESLGLRFAEDAVKGDGSAEKGTGVTTYSVANKKNTPGTSDGAGNRDANLVSRAKSLPLKSINRSTLTSLFGAIGGAYQSIVGGLTLAMHSRTFWELWSNIQDSYPLFTDMRGYDGNRLGPWEVCVDDEFTPPSLGDEPAFTNNDIPIVAGDFMRGWAIRYGGALRLNVSYEEAFTSDQITIRAIQHFDTQPAELPAIAALQVKT